MKNFDDGTNNCTMLCSDENCAVYKIKEKTGEGIMTVYPVFKGCYLIYNDFHLEHSGAGTEMPDADLLFIEHCLEGRIEWEVDRNRYVYLESGDIQVNTRTSDSSNFSYPLKLYHGITIGFDLSEADEGILNVMDAFPVNLRALKDKFMQKSPMYIIRANKQIEHIFSELYNVPDDIRQTYFKIKVLELLLFLNELVLPEGKDERRYFYKSQVDKAKDIIEFLKGDLEHWHTLEELSQKFNFPITSMKKCFKGIYGSTISEYMKEYRMNVAAMEIRNTDKPIIEISAMVGYDNPGKFSSAFRSVMGMTPTEYRKNIVLK